MLIVSMIMSMLFAGSVFDDASDFKEPMVCCDFNDMPIGAELYDGTVTEYKGNKMLKQDLII